MVMVTTHGLQTHRGWWLWLVVSSALAMHSKHVHAMEL
jgi:hypothetical protein